MQQALDRAVDNGVKNLVVQPTHLMHGAEYDELSETVEKYKDKFESVKIAEPLLGEVGADATVINADKEAVAKAITDEAVKTANYDSIDAAAEDGTAFVFMGHGTEHFANSAYSQFENMLRDLGHESTYVGTVEGFPGLDYVIRRLKIRDIKKVYVMPLMIVAGDHARNDLAGAEADSWDSILKADGFETEVIMKGLGEIDAIAEMFVKHLKKAESL